MTEKQKKTLLSVALFAQIHYLYDAFTEKMHTNPITRLHPTAFVLLIDQSGSMKERIVYAGAEMTKSRAVTFIVSSFIDELLYRARREGGTRDYYDIAAVGYSGDGVCSLVSPSGEFTTPSRLAASNVRREKVSRERMLPSGRSVVAVTEHNIRIPEKAVGITPMCGALDNAHSLVEWWCRQKRNRNSYPPTVINITDGEASDGNGEKVRAAAALIRSTGTSDGNTVLMNIHLARRGEDAVPVLFPSSAGELPGVRYARLLWDISSEMPACCNDMIEGFCAGTASPPFRAVGWGSHMNSVAAMMNIGSVNSVML